MTGLPDERTAVVTGAGSPRGIGRATAIRLARAGWQLLVVDIDEEAAGNVADEITAETGVKSFGFRGDITDPESVDEAITFAETRLPPIVGLANIAGISSPTPFLEITTQDWDRVMAVNLRGHFLMTQRVLPCMLELGVGRIVTISSASAQMGGGTYSKVAYSAAKAGVLGMTRALAREVGKRGVTVNAVSPGPIDTDIMGGTLSEERISQILAGLVLDRIGTVDDVAALFEFLMGPDSGFITGATYNVNGGLIID